jgi:Myb-like DNA-binding domain
MIHAPPPSNVSKLRLRARKPTVAEGGSSEIDSALGPGSRGVIIRRKKTAKRSSAPRGINKRRRAIEDEAGRHDNDGDKNEENDKERVEVWPSTPKRLRLAPEVLPMGLERSDFRMLQAAEELERRETTTTTITSAPTIETSDEGVESSESTAWTNEEDRLLVELVLEKLKLSKSDWQDCARSLGKDRSSVGRRWKSLMGGGEIGLKRSTARRSKIHGTWR